MRTHDSSGRMLTTLNRKRGNAYFTCTYSSDMDKFDVMREYCRRGIRKYEERRELECPSGKLHGSGSRDVKLKMAGLNGSIQALESLLYTVFESEDESKMDHCPSVPTEDG